MRHREFRAGVGGRVRRVALALLATALLGSAAAPPRRAAILQAMEQVMGPLPRPRSDAVEVTAFGETILHGYARRRITYLSDDGDAVPAWVLIQRARLGRLPAVVCLHQTTSLGKDEPAGLAGNDNLHYAAELAERGFVAIAPDYPNFGEYHADPYAMGYASATMKGIANHRRAVDVLAAMPQVDASRIGAMGHSLGGHNALFLAAFDERVKAVVASRGFTSFRKYMGGDLGGWSHRGYMPRIAEVYRNDPARMPFDFSDVLEAVAPRAVFLSAPEHDASYDVSGVRDTVAAVRHLFGHGRLEVVYPDTQQDFPKEARERAYQFLDKWLR